MKGVSDTDCQCERVLDVGDQLLQPGWLLIEGRIDCSGSYSSLSLNVMLDSTQLCIMLPANRRGEIHEVVQLPRGVKRLVLQPVVTDGLCKLGDLSFSRCTRLMRWWLMAKRIVPTILSLSPVQRRRIGLSPTTALFSPSRAYALSGQFMYYAPPLDYGEWLARFDLLTDHDLQIISRQSRKIATHAPPLQVIVDIRGLFDQELLERSLESIKQQLYSQFTCLLVIDEGQGSLAGAHFPPWAQVVKQNDLAKSLDDNGWGIVLRAGCYLSPHALYWFIQEVIYRPTVGLIYSDHDLIDSNGVRRSPFFKPDWTPDMAIVTGYPGSVLALRINLLQKALVAANPLEPYSLIMDVAARLDSEAIHHVPALLWQQDSRLQALAPSVEVAERYLSECRVRATAREEEGGLRVRYELPVLRPLVSVIIPTRDLPGLLQPCIESILEKTEYPNYELIVVDNQSCESATLAYLNKIESDPRVNVLRYDHPFNYSAINNFAVQQARGSLVCLLNNDTEVISPDWLDEMVSRIVQTDVGVVGAKLYYSDGRVQHAGDVIGVGGVASHLHAHLDGDAPGYMQRALLPQDLSAVTGACLLTWRDLYLSVGGLDEEHLAVAYNDVDYCLRVRESGKRVVFTPYARLYHHESISRGQEPNKTKRKQRRREERYFRRRWKGVMQRDPFYNPNLSYVRADFSLSCAPLVNRPWENGSDQD